LLPAGSVYIEECWIGGRKHEEFDPVALTVRLPKTDERQKVKVKISPTPWLRPEEGRER